MEHPSGLRLPRERLKAPNTPFVLPKSKPTTSEPLPVPELSKDPLTAYDILYGKPIAFGVHLESCLGQVDGCGCGTVAEKITTFCEYARIYCGHYLYDEMFASPSATRDTTKLAEKLKELFAIVAGRGLQVKERNDNEMVAIAEALIANNLEQLEKM